MNSHELAKKLLELPEHEVFIEVEIPSVNGVGKEYKTLKISEKNQITPSGIFLKSDVFFNSTNIKNPNSEPVIGSYALYFKDETVVINRYDESRRCTATVKLLSTGESRVHEYGSYNMTIHDNFQHFNRGFDTDIVLVTNKETFGEKEQNLYPNAEIRHLEDVDYVRVLISYDKDTWIPTYKRMTYAEAIEFGKGL